MNFQRLQGRLISRLKEIIRNGELSERSLALNVGISQPHIHRVLKGAKALSLENLDVMLMYLNRNLLDLCTQAEIEAHAGKLSVPTQPMADVPVYTSNIGPGCAWLGTLSPHDRKSIPREAIGLCRHVALARLNPDPAMTYSLQNHNLVLLAIDESASLKSASLYAIARGQDVVIRRIRRGRRRVYLVTDAFQNQPLRWEVIRLGERAVVPAVVGRVIWLGTDDEIRQQPATGAAFFHPDQATSSYAAST